MSLIESTVASFDDDLKAAGPIALIDFWAPWCSPCRALEPLLKMFAAEYKGRIGFLKVDADVQQEVARRFGVGGLPTLLLVRDGVLVERLPTTRGALKAALDAALDGTPTPGADEPEERQEPSGDPHARIVEQLRVLIVEVPDKPAVEPVIGAAIEKAIRAADLPAALRTYYLWLRDDPRHGVIRHLDGATEHALFDHMIRLQEAGDALRHQQEWIELYREIGRYSANLPDADRRLHLGDAMTPLDDLGRSGIVALRGQLDRLAAGLGEPGFAEAGTAIFLKALRSAATVKDSR